MYENEGFWNDLVRSKLKIDNNRLDLILRSDYSSKVKCNAFE